jgi:hypothetical protein
MKFLMLSLILISSCSPSPKNAEKIDDDYVLIEFASKLEEDYHRINDESKKASGPESKHP